MLTIVRNVSMTLFLFFALPQWMASAQSKVEQTHQRMLTGTEHPGTPTKAFIEYLNSLSSPNSLSRDDQARQALILYLLSTKRAGHLKIHYVGESHSKDLSKPLFNSLKAKVNSVRNVSQAFSVGNGMREFITMENPSSKEPEDIVWAGAIKEVTENSLLVNGGYRDAAGLMSTHYRLLYKGDGWQVDGTEGVTIVGRITH